PVAVPDVVPPGQTVTIMASLASLGLRLDQPRYVGVRAVDDADNEGPAAVASLTVTSTEPPVIFDVAPTIAQPGLDVRISGVGFGRTEGTVTLTGTESSTLTLTLDVRSWTPEAVLAQIPADASTGLITITRADGPAAQDSIVIVDRVEGLLPTESPPFGFAAQAPDGRAAALYREQNNQSAVIRIIDFALDGDPLLPAVANPRSAQVEVAQRQDLVLFAARGDDGRVDITAVRTSGSPDPHRQSINVGQPPADAVAIAALPSADESIPALLALTIDGVLRTATVNDLRVDPPNEFTPIVSAEATFDSAAVAVDEAGAGVLVYRTVTGTVARLTVRKSTDAATAPFELTSSHGPRAGPHILVRAVPEVSNRFIVAYEHIDANGDSRIRLADVDRIDTSPGLAPFAEDDLQLRDVGWTTLQGQTVVALTAVRRGVSATLQYTEVPMAALAAPSVDGAWPGVSLDVAANDTDARIGCAFARAPICPIAWMGDMAGLLFVRR
ncbi:MAG: hypothetical protein AAFN74_23970, partial [Myxococcota bacterium]